MAYTYQISFKLAREKMELLSIGNALERGLGMLRIMLPNQPGFMNARAFYQMGQGDNTLVVFQSVWETWEDLQAHKDSDLEAKRLLTHDLSKTMKLENVDVQIFNEIA